MKGKNLVCFEIFELNHGRILSKIRAEGIYVEKAVSKGRSLLVYCRKKQLSNIIALFDRMCYNYKSVEYESSVGRLLRRVKSGGIFAAAAVYAALALYANGLVLDVNVRSETVPRTEVVEVLKNLGVEEGKRLTVSETEMENAIIKNIDGVSFASVKKSGCRLNVTVKESLDGERFFDFDKSVIRASKSAVVTRVIVWSGTAECSVGKAVKEGDVLIGGYYTVGDEKVGTAASGEVYGKCYFTAETFYGPNVKTARRTGRSKKKTFLSFFGKKQASFDPGFESYETVITEKTAGIFLPYKYVTVECFETEYVLPAPDFEVVRERLEQEAMALCLQKIPPSAIVSGGWTEVRKVMDGYVVRATVEAEMRIDS